MKLNLATLKQSLSDCHMKGNDPRRKLLEDVADNEYFLRRALECINNCFEGVEVEENSKFAIQLLNIFRVKHGAVQSEGKSADGTGS